MNEINNLVINTQGLTKTFKGVNALQSLNLTVPKNSIFGFLGPNGAGKTTTIKLLLGLSRPTAGNATRRVREFSPQRTKPQNHVSLRLGANCGIGLGSAIRRADEPWLRCRANTSTIDAERHQGQPSANP
jgi:ABC-type uncharacterized transport system ATPase subunit